MGDTKHHSIAVVSRNEELIKKAHKKAIKFFKERVSNILDSDVNRYMSFFIAPDGSEEGWGISDEDDKLRDMFIQFINKQAYEDGSNSLSYCEFFYGEDNGDSEITRHN